jgi:hypothetical protein
MTDYIKQHGTKLEFPVSDSWVILSPIEKRIKEKIERVGKPLKEWDISINYGIKTGCNEAFIIDKNKRDELIKEDAKSAEIIRPILRGRDIERYKINFAELYLINTHNGISSRKIPPVDIKEYPVIKKHLDRYWEKINNREDQGITPYNLRSCAYMDDFSKQKIIYPDIMRMPQDINLLNAYPYFYLDDKGFYAEATNFILAGNGLELIFSYLISDIGFYAFSKFYSGPQFDSTGFRYKKEYINNLFVPILKPMENQLLKSYLIQDSFNFTKTDKTIEEIFIKNIGLDKNEVEVIKTYKISLLSRRKP